MKKDKARQAQRAANTLWLRNGASENRVHYKYGQQSYRKDLQGNEVPDKLLPGDWAVCWSWSLAFSTSALSPMPPPRASPMDTTCCALACRCPCSTSPVRREAAKAWTVERVVAQFQKAGEAIEQAGEAANAVLDENYELKPPHAQALTSAEVAAAKAQWQQLITGRDLATVHKSRKFNFNICAPTAAAGPGKADDQGQLCGHHHQPQPCGGGGVQGQDGKYWINRFYLVEKAPVGVYFGERWSEQYEYALPSAIQSLSVNPQRSNTSGSPKRRADL